VISADRKLSHGFIVTMSSPRQSGYSYAPDFYGDQRRHAMTIEACLAVARALAVGMVTGIVVTAAQILVPVL
jgi:hypothetical protein